MGSKGEYSQRNAIPSYKRKNVLKGREFYLLLRGIMFRLEYFPLKLICIIFVLEIEYFFYCCISP